jgi:hypothetical protein
MPSLVQVVEGSTATVGCAPHRMLYKKTARARVPVQRKPSSTARYPNARRVAVAGAARSHSGSMQAIGRRSAQIFRTVR